MAEEEKENLRLRLVEHCARYDSGEWLPCVLNKTLRAHPRRRPPALKTRLINLVFLPFSFCKALRGAMELTTNTRFDFTLPPYHTSGEAKKSRIWSEGVRGGGHVVDSLESDP